MTDREALAAALDDFDNWTRLMGASPDLLTIALAARERLAQLKRDCRDCAGTGEEWASEARVDKQECFVCGGSGKVYPDELVRIVSMEFAAALASFRSEMMSGVFVELCNNHAVAVLDALDGKTP